MASVPITSGGIQLSIADLAIQPGTGVLFGVSSPNGTLAPGQLYTINRQTGVAFAPNGTLYEALADFAGAGPINPRSHRIAGDLRIPAAQRPRHPASGMLS